MTPDQFLAIVAFAKTLEQLIEFGFEEFRKKGELTPELEAAYQAHQAAIYARPSAQPEPSGDATKPDL